jgi:hypothetical protein
MLSDAEGKYRLGDDVHRLQRRDSGGDGRPVEQSVSISQPERPVPPFCEIRGGVGNT